MDYTPSLSTCLLTKHFQQRLFEVVAFSLDQSTCDGYGAGLLRFTQFYDYAKVAEQDRMLASELLLSLFIYSSLCR
jgi:hypothetical protein